MKLYTSVLILLLLIIIIPDIFFYLKLKNKNVRPIFIVLHLIPAFIFAGIFFYIKFELIHHQNFRIILIVMWFYFFFLLIYIPKLLHIIFYFLNYLFKLIFKRDSIYFNIIRIVVTVLVVVIMLISAYVTPRNFEVTNINVRVKNLPEAFDGFKIVHVSDIHLGSWNNKYERFKPVVDKINQQNADIIVFSGDMVNNFAEEADGWKSTFTKLESKSGKFAVLGNHDYGDYIDWKSENDRKSNRLKINQSIRDFGFRLLLNESVYLKKGSDSLLLAGVENWTKHTHSHYEDLDKALKNKPLEIPKILISHDPTHWDDEVIGKKDIFLTLSGHTHAAQLGIRIGKRIYSPATFVFKHWAGLYRDHTQFLYVNRGLGYMGLPMHIGVRPEITVLTLKKIK